MSLPRRHLVLLASLFSTPAFAADLILNGTTQTLGGNQSFDNISLTNGAKIIVPPYDGVDKVNTGNLVLHGNSITIDATSSITARGAGYKTPLCGNGTGPSAAAAGKGGCAVRDSGGGGAHFGGGGRGTKDCPVAGCSFPHDFEEDCVNSLNMAGTACSDLTDCRNNDALPTIAGAPYFHSPWAIEFGASGGDKGCRDNDGFALWPGTTTSFTGGSGGGRIVIAGTNAGQTGTVSISGTITADGFRGCASGNDSGGGGAGGSVLIVGDAVTIGASAVITARGGLGGDSGNKDFAVFPECTGTQVGGTCDDCGGGGGGGIVNVMSRAKATISSGAQFSVAGALGGTCAICQGEAGGGAGELQIDGAYVGEICDGLDNDFDGVADNGFGTAQCGLGMCQMSIQTCTAGAPPICAPASGPSPTCQGSRGTSRPRVSLILDTSASMLLTLNGTPTFGDGSADHPGIDLSANGQPDDSRLFLAKGAVSQVIANYPEIDFLLARYHQDELINRACQAAKWLECGGLSGTLASAAQCCTYDNPQLQDPASPLDCTLTLTRTDGVSTFSQAVRQDPMAGVNRCINYAGTCGAPRRGADILVGFESDVRQYLSWLDGGETNFNAATVPGNYCGGLTGDCELRGTGPTPIAESLRAVYDYVTPIQAVDPAASCRGYSIILVSDGGEECGGNPVAAAGELLAKSIKTYVIGVSVNAAQGATLNAIAAAGGTTSFVPVNNPNQLLPALTSIISASIKTELCNGLDDNCNGLTDEGFNVGAACDNGLKGKCFGTGVLECDPADSKKTRCHITMGGGSASAELCNSIDDNCNGLTDEGNPQGGGVCGSSVGACKTGMLVCQGGKLDCVGDTGPKPETCNGIDDDCNTMTDDGVPPGGPCGSSVGECKPGSFACMGASGYVCQGGTGPTTETCNGKDDDCNGAIDDNVPGTNLPCNTDAMGAPLCKPGVLRCIGGTLVCQGGVAFHPPTCTCPPDDCAVTDDAGASSGCPSGSACISCACRTPCAGGEFPCSGNFVCRNNFCVPPECGGKLCTSGEVCVNDQCVDKCTQTTCSNGQVCKPGGTCVDNNCYTLGCPSGQMCTNGACTADPCTDVSCAVDQFCRAGSCVGTCAGVQCEKGQHCQDGACVEDPCSTVSCNTGDVCSVLAGAPTCIPDPCASLSCGQGRVCKEGSCIDDPCSVIHCPGDPLQVVCRDGQCVDVNPLMPLAPQDRVAASGGGGWLSCSFSDGGRGSGGFALLVVLALVAVRRRRAA